MTTSPLETEISALACMSGAPSRGSPRLKMRALGLEAGEEFDASVGTVLADLTDAALPIKKGRPLRQYLELMDRIGVSKYFQPPFDSFLPSAKKTLATKDQAELFKRFKGLLKEKLPIEEYNASVLSDEAQFLRAVVHLTESFRSRYKEHTDRMATVVLEAAMPGPTSVVPASYEAAKIRPSESKPMPQVVESERELTYSDLVDQSKLQNLGEATPVALQPDRHVTMRLVACVRSDTPSLGKFDDFYDLRDCDSAVCRKQMWVSMVRMLGFVFCGEIGVAPLEQITLVTAPDYVPLHGAGELPRSPCRALAATILEVILTHIC